MIGLDLSAYFRLAKEKKASDLYLLEGKTPAVRIGGRLYRLPEKPIAYGELRYAVSAYLDNDSRARLGGRKEIDVIWEVYDCRFRINLHYQKGKMALAARTIPIEIPTPSDIALEAEAGRVIDFTDGLVLIAGPSGAGKSTTLAVLIEMINGGRTSHIITIEDPIEFVFADRLSLVEQRQVGDDTASFASGLRACLRQNPDVIMVGEIRDHETLTTALLAARTGHLVFSTLHAANAAEAVKRIFDFFPPGDLDKAAVQLSSELRAVIAQNLLPAADGGMVAAREIMFNTPAVGNLIRERKIDQIASIIQTGLKEGMRPMSKSVEALLSAGRISEETVRSSAAGQDHSLRA